MVPETTIFIVTLIIFFLSLYRIYRFFDIYAKRSVRKSLKSDVFFTNCAEHDVSAKEIKRRRFYFAIFVNWARSHNIAIETHARVNSGSITREREGRERENERGKRKGEKGKREVRCSDAACHVALHALPCIDRDDNSRAITGSASMISICDRSLDNAFAG